MLIVLEGTDLAGKSTLAKQLTEAATNLGWTTEVLTAGPPDPELSALDEYEMELLPVRDRALALDHLVVLDRWHLGELVYGPLLRGRSRLTMAQFEHVELFLDALGAQRAIVDPSSEEVLRKRYAKRGDPLLTEDQVVGVRRWYMAAANEHHWRVLHSPASRRVVLDLLMWAQVTCKRAGELAPFPGYVGGHAPALLVMGDAPNGLVEGAEPNPAFMPYDGNSAHYLIDAIRSQASAFHQFYGLANANDGTDAHALWEALGRPRTVALGKRAQATLTKLDVPHHQAPHPQWVRRFRHREQEQYGYAVVHAGHIAAA